MAFSLLFREFKEKCKIDNTIINYQRKENDFVIYIYSLEKDMDIKKEKKQTIKLVLKTWILSRFKVWAAKLGAAQGTKRNFNQTNIFFYIHFQF